MKDSEDVQKLLRLKRYESPGEEYFQQFSEDFKDRQRSELLKGSARSLLIERASLWLDEMSPNRWAIPATATACAAALTVGAFVAFQPGETVSAENSVAEVETLPSTLPRFEGTTDEVIELSLPKPSSRIPGEALQQNSSILTAGAARGFREL
ncbi:MAG: hypothetical protein P1U58_06365 [Verrucomicrobiales bacterium]|nr:hypothetical protein [Verrucomicrobiales bacterium]